MIVHAVGVDVRVQVVGRAELGVFFVGFPVAVVVLAGVAGLHGPVEHLGVVGGAVRVVGVTVPVAVRVADIAQPVPVLVFLAGVGHCCAVVHGRRVRTSGVGVVDTVSIPVAVAGVTRVVAVLVFLARVGFPGAVVRPVQDPVTVPVVLAGIPDLVVVQVRLVVVGGLGTVVVASFVLTPGTGFVTVGSVPAPVIQGPVVVVIRVHAVGHVIAVIVGEALVRVALAVVVNAIAFRFRFRFIFGAVDQVIGVQTGLPHAPLAVLGLLVGAAAHAGLLLAGLGVVGEQVRVVAVGQPVTVVVLSVADLGGRNWGQQVLAPGLRVAGVHCAGVSVIAVRGRATRAGAALALVRRGAGVVVVAGVRVVHVLATHGRIAPVVGAVVGVVAHRGLATGTSAALALVVQGAGAPVVTAQVVVRVLAGPRVFVAGIIGADVPVATVLRRTGLADA